MTEKEPSPEPKPPPRGRGPTWRELTLWSAGGLLVLGLAWLVCRGVIPFLQTRAAVLECTDRICHTHGTGDYAKDYGDEAVARLGGPDRAFPKLALYLRMPDWLVVARPWAAVPLSCCGKRAVPALLRALSDANSWARCQAARGLGRIGPDAAEAVPVLLRALDDTDENVRGSAACALGRIGPATRDVIPRLIRMLRDKDDCLSADAAWALGEIGPEAAEAVPALVEALDRHGSLFQGSIIVALGRIGPGATAAAPALTRCLDDLWLRNQASDALDKIGADAQGAIPALERLRAECHDEKELRRVDGIMERIRGKAPGAPKP